MKTNNQNILDTETKSEVVLQPIIKLDEALINKIAAGEVVERPAAAVKELIENAIDAQATSIQIFFSSGGKSLLKIIDNGFGIKKNQLKLALKSHSTSKMHDTDLSKISTLGFRGEALPSIAAVSKMILRSRAYGALEAYELISNAGRTEEIRPSSIQTGTSVEVRDLFYVTPVRLKFLRTDRVEAQAIFDIVKRLTLANPEIKFLLKDITQPENKKDLLDLPAESGEDKFLKRINRVMGLNFTENSVRVYEVREQYSLFGYTSLPTNSTGSSSNQYFFVNGRSVKDKQLLGALRAAYFDFITKDRYASAVLYFGCEPSLVDINVHPMKSEVRFKDPKDIRSLIISVIKSTLAQNGLQSNSVLRAKTLSSFSISNEFDQKEMDDNCISVNNTDSRIYESKLEQMDFSKNEKNWISGKIERNDGSANYNEDETFLGVAKAQIHENYIVAQSKNGLVLVDQHAAHERITYEKLKLSLIKKRVESQALLIPEIVELLGNEKEVILEFSESLREIGFELDSFGEDAVCVRAVPAILGLSDLKILIRDLIDELLIVGTSDSVEVRINAVISRISCHGSVRSGRRLNSEEMNQLLRQMESTPFAGQCNHGRPTFIELKLADIEKLFGRS